MNIDFDVEEITGVHVIKQTNRDGLSSTGQETARLPFAPPHLCPGTISVTKLIHILHIYTLMPQTWRRPPEAMQSWGLHSRQAKC